MPTDLVLDVREGRELRRHLQTELIADRCRRSRTQLELAVVEYIVWNQLNGLRGTWVPAHPRLDFQN